MIAGENTACSFVVRIWVDSDDELKTRFWRGRVTAIPGNAQKYFDDLAQLNEFIAVYLEQMGVSTKQETRS